MSNTATIRRSVVLKRRPNGSPRREDFEIIEDAIPSPATGEVVTRTIWLSIDPYMRGRLREQQTYAQPVNPGEVMTGETVGEVLASADPRFRCRRCRGGCARLADAFGDTRRSADQARSPWRAAVGVSRCAWHAGRHCVSRRHRDPAAEAGRDGGDLRRVRRGRFGGRTVGQACRRARGGRGRWGGKVPVGAGQPRLR